MSLASAKPTTVVRPARARVSLAIIVLLALVGPQRLVQAQASQPIPDSAAARHVGEVAAVVGTVASVHTSRSGTTFLNFGSAYPNQDFTAVIFRSSASRFNNPAQWQGHRVVVTGAIRMYQGKPEIVLETPSQITLAH